MKIIIENPPNGVRTGMTAKVTILSEKIENALQIPLPAVFRTDGSAYCLVGMKGEELQLRAIELGPHNMTHAVVSSGLQAGELVVLNPEHFRASFEENAQKELALK